MKHMFRKSWALSLISAAICLALGSFLILRKNASGSHDYTVVNTINPTCSTAGYSLVKNNNTGSTSVTDIVSPLGHLYENDTEIKVQTGTELGTHVKTCSRCGHMEEASIFPEDTIAHINFVGDMTGISKNSDVSGKVELNIDGKNITAYALLKLQGHKSLQYEKTNYTLRLYEDDLHEKKKKIEISDWGKEHKYILKANYNDATQCRNIVCANIWADIVASRSGADSKLLGLSNHGAVDGFPVAVYINNEFHGLYTMNLHKDDDLFEIEEGEHQAVAILNYNTSDEALFRAQSEFGENSDWEIEACGTEDSAWAQESFNKLICFAINSSDEEFKEDLWEYLDIDAAVDYLITMYCLGLTRNGTKDLVMITYDGNVWIPSMYDMEKAFSLFDDGTGANAADMFLPYKDGSVWCSGTESLLWDRLIQNYTETIQNRYMELRKTILDESNICQRVDDFVSCIPEEYYSADMMKYGTEEKSDFNPVQQIKEYIAQRLPIMDEIIADLGDT